ncbi:diguanylate cyclase/phosphodiesterase (GGDEF & EAL domains) with PAS/PAC sensor(s) [hydrothermal vent metagenome]|uniref:Diguanylate cyclase/phosphodiesterase (GGDEF & EAL domains) with PAS/PAC sensor(S) n=1 Tax=hydrothermal vent metagenome TaxID=652676 RepID=A0A3B0Y5W0_9ZZZZ
MKLLQPSMRSSLLFIILLVALLGIILAIATGETYQRLALDNQRKSFAALAKLKVDEVIRGLSQDSSQLGLSTQASARFHRIFATKDPVAISEQLDEHFYRGLVTLGRIKLLRIYAFDTKFKHISTSTEGALASPGDRPVCTWQLDNIAAKNTIQRLKPDSALCRVDGRAVLSTVVPIGGLIIKGHLQLIVDPTPNLSQVDQGLGTPLTLTGSSKNVRYRSDNWPDSHNKNILLAQYNLSSAQDKPLYTFTFATNITSLNEQLSSTRTFIFSIAAVVMLCAIALALFMLQRITLRPLGMLADHLRRVQSDKAELGKEVVVSGNTEIVALAADFNNMSTTLHTLYSSLESMAFTDALTGLANRALFYDRLEQAARMATRYRSPFVLLMMDLDRFKRINDSLGHHVGDQLLLQLGQRLKTVLRKSDTLARLGGDEFAALLPVMQDEHSADAVALKILQALENPFAVEGHSLSVGISIGIASCPGDGNASTQLMQCADLAMYHAKRKGKGYSFYSKDMNRENLFEVTMEAALSETLENGGFELYYQPKIDFGLGKITAVEALIRWMHPEYGFISPEKFIPLAEQTNQMQSLTNWVLHTALQQCAQWHAEGIMIGVSINLSASSLGDAELADSVHVALSQAKIAPEWLTLELTETAIMSDADLALHTLSRLDTMGVRLSVDDFGTGYSSLAYLKRLPVDEIKIDKSFVIDMLGDISDTVIVRSTIDLAHNMGMTVVAEGIEDQSTWDKLAELHCDLGQGFHMCRPCSADKLHEWLKTSSWGLSAGKNPVLSVVQESS